MTPPRSFPPPRLALCFGLLGAISACKAKPQPVAETKAAYDINWTQANGPTVGPVQLRRDNAVFGYTLAYCDAFTTWYRLSERNDLRTKADIRRAIVEAQCRPLLLVNGKAFVFTNDPEAKENPLRSAFDAELLKAMEAAWVQRGWTFNAADAMTTIKSIFDRHSHDPAWSPETVQAYAAAAEVAFTTFAPLMPETARYIGLED